MERSNKMGDFEKALKGSRVDGWKAEGDRFNSDPDVFVIRVKHTDGRIGVCKASCTVPGRIRNENVYLEMAIDHAKRLGSGGEKALPEVLQRHRLWGEKKKFRFKIPVVFFKVTARAQGTHGVILFWEMVA